MIHRIYRFGEFRLDPAARSLFRGAEALTLPAKAFDCIVYLVEQRERAVGRDELIAAVWGKTDVSDGVLGQTILVARRALDDTGREQTVIRTVLRFGYHWVAPTEAIEAAAATGVGIAEARSGRAGDVRSAETSLVNEVPRPGRESNTEAISTTSKRRPGPLLTFGAAALLALCGLIAWIVFDHRAGERHANAASALALVLPVAVSGDDAAASAWMRLGVMDLIAGRMRNAGQAVVPSDNVVALAHGEDSASLHDAEVARIAVTAAAGLVIDARVRRDGARWRVDLATRRGRQPPLAASAESGDVLEAARSATDALALSLGLAAAHGTTASSGDPALDTLLQKVEATLLVDRVDEARSLIDAAAPALRARPEVRFQQGQVEFKSGRLDAAQATFEALLDSKPGPDDILLRGRTYNAFGGIAIERHDPAGALPSLDKAVDLLGRAHAADALGTTLNNRAAAHGLVRDYDAALADFAQARIVLQAAGDGLGLAVSNSNLATLDMNRGRYAEAAPVLERAIARFAGFHAWDAELNARANEVLVRLALLEPEKALVADPRIQELIAKVASPAGRAVGGISRVDLLFANGRLAEARALLAVLRAKATHAANRPTLARLQAVGARDLLDSGQPAAAAAEAQAARGNFSVAEEPVEFADNWLTLLRAQMADGHIDQAAAGLAEASAWADRDGSPGARLRMLIAQAELEAERNHADRAGAAYEQALALADSGRVPADVLAVCASYVAWLFAQHEPARAAVVAERVSGWATQDYAAALLQVRLYHELGRASAWQSALARARTLAGERAIPAAWLNAP